MIGRTGVQTHSHIHSHLGLPETLSRILEIKIYHKKGIKEREGLTSPKQTPPHKYFLTLVLGASNNLCDLDFHTSGQGDSSKWVSPPPAAISKPGGGWVVGGCGAPPLLPGRRVLRQTDSHVTVTFWEASSADGDGDGASAACSALPACFQPISPPSTHNQLQGPPRIPGDLHWSLSPPTPQHW